MKPKLSGLVFRQEYFFWLLPLFFVLHGYVENFWLIPFTAVLKLLLYYWAASLLLALGSYLIVGSWRKAAIFTTGLMALNFFFGSLHDFSKNLLGNIFLTRYTFLLVAIFLSVLLWFVFIKKSRRSFNRTTRYANLLLLILLLIDLALLGTKLANEPPKQGFPAGLQRCDTCVKPSIYLIVADEYAGLQELKDQFNFDNTPFYKALVQRGFQVTENARSNYNFTPFSVASLLNFDYLPLKNPQQVAPETGKITELIKNSRVQAFLEAIGYKTYNHSVFDLEGLPTESVETFLPAKTKFITAQTFFNRLERDLYFNLITRFKIRWIIKKSMYHSRQNNRLLYQRTLATSRLTITSKFVYTHLMLPHFPYYFDENGKPNSYESLFDAKNKTQYLSYLKYANQQYLALIDAILKNEKQPPLIILVSDHGFRTQELNRQPEYLFMNLCAVYAPGPLPPRQRRSNVNLFREIFNVHFGQKLPLLKDSTIFLQD